MRRVKAVVAGAGIGGLYTACALALRGVETVVVERAEALGEVGAGLQLGANATRLLPLADVQPHRLGGATRAEAVELIDGLRGGAPYLRIPLGAEGEARWGASFLQIHRADLHNALLMRAREAGVALRLGETVEALTPEGVALLSTGDAVEGDVALGADGLRSRTRAVLFGEEAPRFAGYVCWRATIPAARLPARFAAPRARVWTGPGRHLVAYPLRGGTLVNLVATVERVEPASERWRREGDPAELCDAFAGWTGEVQTLTGAVESCLLWGLYTRDPLPVWSRGRAALLGDAAHPTTPFMAQGAGQAIEDGAALAGLLPGAEDQAAALAAYSVARKPRADRVVEMAAENARVFHAAGLMRAALTSAPARLAGRMAPRLFMARLDRLYGHDGAAQLSSRAAKQGSHG